MSADPDLRAMYAKATKGPWIADDFCEDSQQATRVGTYDGTEHYYHRTATVAYCMTNHDDDDLDGSPKIGIVAAEANAALIAAMHTALPSLLDEIEALREALKPFADRCEGLDHLEDRAFFLNNMQMRHFRNARLALQTPEGK